MLSLVEKIVFSGAALLVAVLVFLAGRAKLRLIMKGRPVNRFDRPLKRIIEMLRQVLFQIPVFSNRPVVGFFHAVIFWGFLVFMLVTVSHVIEGFSSSLHLLGPGFLSQLVLMAAHLFALLIIAAVLFFFFRRYVFKAPGLDRPSWESLIILSFIFMLMVTFIFFEAFKLYNQAPGWGVYIARAAHDLILPDSLAPAALAFWLKLLWWWHILIILVFAVFIMYSKHLHLIAGPANILFKNNGVLAEIEAVNLEEQESFGIAKVTELTRKDLLDLFSCAECGRCEDVCPAFQSGKKLSPKQLLNTIKENLLLQSAAGADQKTLFREVVAEEVVWDCTSCAACMAVCPMDNEHLAKLIGMRQYAVMMESSFPDEFQVLFRGLENQGNPWGLSSASRSDWIGDLEVPMLADCKKTDLLFWVGCAASYDQHSQKIARAMVRLLKKAGVDFAILGNEETCCGDSARRTGHEYLFQMLAAQNIETLGRYSFNRIVTVCPHGLHVLRHEYGKMGTDLKVIHHSQLLLELVQAGRLKLKPGGAERITFHDPCYLGRYNGIYREPRQLLTATGAGSLLEMKLSQKRSFCCGAGGGGMWKEEHSGKRISHCRISEAKASGADILATACPFCAVMFKDALAETGIENLRSADIALILEELSAD